MLRMCRAATVIIQQQFPVAQVLHLLCQDLLLFRSAALAVKMVRLERFCVFGNRVIVGVAEEHDRMHTQRTQLFERRFRVRLHNFLQQDLARILLTDGYIGRITVRQVCVRNVHTLEDHQLARADANAGRFNINLHTALGNIDRPGEILRVNGAAVRSADRARRAAVRAGLRVGRQLQQRFRHQLTGFHTDHLRELAVPLPFVDRDCTHGVERAHAAAAAKQHVAVISAVDGTVPHQRHGNEQRARCGKEEHDHGGVNCPGNRCNLEHDLQHGNEHCDAQTGRCKIADPLGSGKFGRRMDLTADGGRQRFFRMDCDDRDQDRHDPVHKQENSGVDRLSDCRGADHAHDHDHCGPEHLPVENARDRSRKVVISGSKHGQDQKHVAQHGAVHKRADDAQDQCRRKTHNQHQIQSRFRKQAQRFPIIIRPVSSKAACRQPRQKFLKIHGSPPCFV